MDPALSLAHLCSSQVGGGLFIFMALLERLLRRQSDISEAHQRPVFQSNPSQEYDFIVIGAGSAGCVVASRLSENPDHRVLLVEAGGREPIGLAVPAFQNMFVTTPVDWNYQSESNGKSYLSNPGQHATYPRGKMIGGTSSLNGLMYMRDNPADFGRWEAMGNANWSFADVLPFFRKSEDNAQMHGDPAEGFSAVYHSKDGYLSVEQTYRADIAELIMHGVADVGFDVVNDLNGAQQQGFAFIQATSENGVRDGTARAFLGKAYGRSNLDVLSFRRCTKVLLDESGSKAIGVELMNEKNGSNGAKTTIRAKREVIISAGVFESPKLLQLSGIGSSEDLDRVGITKLVDLPGVGKNLQNHLASFIPYEVELPNKEYINNKNAMEYLHRRSGLLSTQSLNLQGKIAGHSANGPEDPDLNLLFFTDFILSHQLCSKDGNNTIERPSLQVLVLPAFLQPKSVGYVRVNSSDPFAYPEIAPNMLDVEEDGQRILEAIEITQKIMLESKTMQRYNTKHVPATDTPCVELEIGSSEYWRCFMAYKTEHVHHPVGTCKMGPTTDHDAVVDAELRVHGVQNLRVADASIMPTIVSANTNAATIMIGERAADFVRKQWD